MSSRKKVKLGPIDLDIDQFALIVHYTTETHHLDEFGNTLDCESTANHKVVRLPRQLASHNIAELAREVVDKCKYISSSKVGEVESLIALLAERELGGHEEARAATVPQRSTPGDGQRGTSSSRPARRRDDDEVPTSNARLGGTANSLSSASRSHPRAPQARQEPLLPHAEARFIEEYADKLYEENMNDKIHAAKCILRVCSEAPNLEIIAEHDTVLGVLSRELRESSKKSSELSIAIVCCFLCFSHFSQLHPLLMQHQCGDVTMRVVEYESQRHQVRKEDMDKKRRRIEELGDQATSDERRQLAKDEKKYRIQLNRQNKLMHICQMMLLNIAEELAVERKMVNRKMPLMLSQMLDRSNEDLLLVALQFLKKLTVFDENKETISAPPTLSALLQHATHSNVRVALLALRTLFNVSFDEAIRSSLVEAGIVQLLVNHLRNPPFRHIVLRLLYHFSMDDRCRSTMAHYQDGMIMLLQLVVHFPEPRVGKDLVALVVNLATHQRAAEVMVASGLFPQVVLRIIKTRDPLLCKVIRHVTSHPDVLPVMYELLQSEGVRMSRWVNEFVNIANRCLENPDFLVEVLGTLANLTLPEVPWGELCECGLIELLQRTLAAGSLTEDDIILECVMVVGNVALCSDACPHVAASKLPAMLQDLLVEKHDDDEIVMQLLFTFQCLLVHDEVREGILQDTDIAPVVMRYSRSRNVAILEQASKTLQVIAEYGTELTANSDGSEQLSWMEQIKQFRFEQHNSDWCKFLEREQSGAAPAGYRGYYDGSGEGETGSEAEEEFAFHWADAADAQDLANRDWQNRDMGDLMHTSRHM